MELLLRTYQEGGSGILTYLITKSTKGASSRAAPFFMAGLTVRKSQRSGALHPLT